MNIGSVFFDFRGEGGQLQVDAQKAAEAAAGVSGRAFTATFHQSLKQSILQGVGLGAGIGGFNLLSTAIHKTTDFLGDVIKAGIDEEASISALGASLRANVPNWDGNTAAIEKVLAARIKLGFSDEEQRKSLQLLVAATHDVNKALDIERVAMDLARFKRISLSDATDALTKVEAGSYRILKSLGIELKTGATQTEALAAVQRVASGAAEEFATTTEGKLLVAQTKFGEKMDELGVAILPAVSDALTIVTDGFDGISAGMDKAGDSSASFIDRAMGLGDALFHLNPMTAAQASLQDELRKKDDAAAAAAAKLATTTDTLAGATRDADGQLSDLAKATYDVSGMMGDAIGPSANLRGAYHDIYKAARDAAGKTRDLTSAVYDAEDAMIEAAFGPEQLRLKLQGSQLELKGNIRELHNLEAIKHPTLQQQQDINDLKLRISEGRAEVVRLQGKLNGLDGLTLKDIKATIAGLGSKTHYALLQAAALYDAYYKLDSVGIDIGGSTGTGKGGGPIKTAGGGRRAANQLLMVGEKGPELWVPETNGTMVPNDQLHVVPALAAGGDTYQISVPVQGLLRATDPMEVATQIRRVARLGLISAKPVYG